MELAEIPAYLGRRSEKDIDRFLRHQPAHIESVARCAHSFTEFNRGSFCQTDHAGTAGRRSSRSRISMASVRSNLRSRCTSYLAGVSRPNAA